MATAAKFTSLDTLQQFLRLPGHGFLADGVVRVGNVPLEGARGPLYCVLQGAAGYVQHYQRWIMLRDGEEREVEREREFEGLGFMWRKRKYCSTGYLTPIFRVHVVSRARQPIHGSPKALTERLMNGIGLPTPSTRRRNPQNP